jgi:hypothetical protein
VTQFGFFYPGGYYIGCKIYHPGKIAFDFLGEFERMSVRNCAVIVKNLWINAADHLIAFMIGITIMAAATGFVFFVLAYFIVNHRKKKWLDAKTGYIHNLISEDEVLIKESHKGKKPMMHIYPFKALRPVNPDEAKAAIEAYLASTYTDSLGNVSHGREIFYYKRGLYYLQANQTDSAEYFFRKELRDGLDINNQIAGRKGLQLLYEKLGKADSVAKYAAEGYAMSDSVYMVSESQNLQSLQAMFDYTHKQLMVEQKTSELRNTRLYLAIAVISLLLVIFIVLYIIQRRDKLHAAATANYQSIIRELSIEDRLGCSPVTTHLQELANSNPPEVADAADIKSLKTLISDNIPTFFDTVNPPQQMLSEQEYVVCLLTRLAFPSVSIDRLTGVSEGYTSKLKSRLYKKLTGKDGSAKDFEHWIMAVK